MQARAIIRLAALAAAMWATAAGAGSYIFSGEHHAGYQPAPQYVAPAPTWGFSVELQQPPSVATPGTWSNPYVVRDSFGRAVGTFQSQSPPSVAPQGTWSNPWRYIPAR